MNIGKTIRIMLFAGIFGGGVFLCACRGGAGGAEFDFVSPLDGNDVDEGFLELDAEIKEIVNDDIDLSLTEHDNAMEKDVPHDQGFNDDASLDENAEGLEEMQDEGFEDSANCVFSSDCPVGFYCLASRCVPWECVPGKKWCEEGNVVQCSLTGDGYEVLEICDDGDPCTIGDTCENGRCVAGEPLDCDDQNPCTYDFCSLGECEHSATQGSCDDKNPCTTSDSCIDGACVGEPLQCDDKNPCTDDFCDPLVGCKYLPNLALCDDKNPCTVGDMCNEGVCMGVDAFSCDDNDECTLDYCNKDTGACEHQASCPICLVDPDCDDHDMCTVDVCEKGYCRAYPSRLEPCCTEDSDCATTYECSTVRCTNHRCTYFSLDESSCCKRDVFFEDFSQGGSGIVTDPPVEGVGWQVLSSGICYSQKNCLYYGNPLTMSFDSSSRNSGTATTQAIRLPAHAQTTLSLFLFMDCETTPNHDVLKIFALTESGRYLLWEKPPQFIMRQWNPIAIDISALSGRFVRLEFAFDTVDEKNNTGTGVIVDDIKIVSTCRPKACNIPLDCHFLDYAADCVDSTCDFGSVFSHTFSIRSGAGAGKNLLSPYGVAWADGRLYVTDEAQNSVFVYALQNGGIEPLSVFGTGTLKAPHGIRVLGSRVFVADTENHRIAVFTTRGAFVFAFGFGTESYSPMKQPKDIALTHDGGVVYVADTGNHRVMAFDPDGHFLLEFGEYGRKDGQFRSPSCIAVTSDYKVIVCDTVNQRFQVFTYDGQFISKISFQGDFALDYPYGVLVIEPSEIWISDTFHHRLIRATLDGLILDTFGAYGSSPGSFKYPFSIARSEDSRMFVADSNNSRVAVIERISLP